MSVFVQWILTDLNPMKLTSYTTTPIQLSQVRKLLRYKHNHQDTVWQTSVSKNSENPYCRKTEVFKTWRHLLIKTE